MLGRALAYIDFLKMIKSANLLIHVLERFGEKIGAPTVIYVNNYGHNNMKPNFNLSLRNWIIAWKELILNISNKKLYLLSDPSFGSSFSLFKPILVPKVCWIIKK